jgi:hypothetical protein
MASRIPISRNTQSGYALRVVALLACPRCNVHVKAFERHCPHCGNGLSTVGATATALLLGLSLSSCGSMTPEPADIYGAPPSDDDDDKKGDTSPVKQPDAKKPDAKKPDAKKSEPAPP